MPYAPYWIRSIGLAATVGAGMALGGCSLGGGDVELNGGVFDMLGVSSSTQTSSVEPKVTARPGIVLPPRTDRLPEPGSEPTTVASAEWPEDVDQRRIRSKEELERQQAEFCRKAELEAATQSTPVPATGPAGPCQKSLLSGIGTNLTGN